MHGYVKFHLSLLLFLSCLSVNATTLVQLQFDEVIEQAEFVFHGHVVAVESRQTGPRMIQTFVRFDVREVLKGDDSITELELSFMGGQVDGRQLMVSELYLPQLGETGYYFVESLSQPMVNPLVGWSQGHFLLEENEDGARQLRHPDRSAAPIDERELRARVITLVGHRPDRERLP